MAYEPRTREEIKRRVLGSLVARSQLSDTAQGSVIDTLAGSVAAVGAGVELSLAQIRDSFDLRNASGSELDTRVAEFPPSTIERLPADRAQGRLTLLVGATVNAFTISAGATFSRTDSGVSYSSLEDLGVASSANSQFILLPVECNAEGSIGNAPAGRITVIDSAPSQVQSVSNAQAFTNGHDQESDARLKRRALLYLQSLARSQPAALEFAALSARRLSQRLVVATGYEIPQTLGMTYLYIDDGSGDLENAVTDGRAPRVVVPTQGLTTFFHDAPATEDVKLAKEVNSQLIAIDPASYVSIPERGEIYIDAGAVSAGDVLTVEPYQVWTGAIKIIQELVEGDPHNPEAGAGLRAAGTRVRVRSPEIHRASFDVQIQTRAGVDFDALQSLASKTIAALTLELRVSRPLFIASIIDVLMDLEGVQNVHVYESGSVNSQRDIYPPQGSVVRVGTVNIIPLGA